MGRPWQWGDVTYGDAEKKADQTPVPLKHLRCPSAHAVGNPRRSHVCKMHHEHTGEHRCICGNKWAA